MRFNFKYNDYEIRVNNPSCFNIQNKFIKENINLIFNNIIKFNKKVIELRFNNFRCLAMCNNQSKFIRIIAVYNTYCFVESIDEEFGEYSFIIINKKDNIVYSRILKNVPLNEISIRDKINFIRYKKVRIYE